MESTRTLQTYHPGNTANKSFDDVKIFIITLFKYSNVQLWALFKLICQSNTL